MISKWQAKGREFCGYDRVSAERRRLPMVKVEKDYVFDGPKGRQRLKSLFCGCRQLIIYHFMFDPEWKSGCPACTGYQMSEYGTVRAAGWRIMNTEASIRGVRLRLQELTWAAFPLTCTTIARHWMHEDQMASFPGILRKSGPRPCDRGP